MINLKKKSISLEQKRIRWGYIFALPFAVGFVLFFLSPLILYVILGFSKLSPDQSGYAAESRGIGKFSPGFIRESRVF